MIARLALAGALCASPASACTAIILALDVSNSIDAGEYRQMREGIAAALVDPAIIEAATGGDYRLAVFEWANGQQVTLGWSPIGSEAELRAAAGAILAAPRAKLGGATGTGEAMRFGVALGEATECADIKLNVVSDGEHNHGVGPGSVRDGLTTFRTQINGVAIGTDGSFLRDRVIYGSGSFVEVADDFDGFERAMVRKLGREIVGS